MGDLNSSPHNDKPSMDLLFPDLKKAGAPTAAPRFMQPSLQAAALMGQRAPVSIPAPPPPPSVRSKVPSAPPPARAAAPVQAEELVADDDVEDDFEEVLDASDATEVDGTAISPVDDDYSDEGPTVMRPSPLLASPPLSLRSFKEPAARPSAPAASSLRAAPPPNSLRQPPPSVAKLPPIPTPPPSLRSTPRVEASSPRASAPIPSAPKPSVPPPSRTAPSSPAPAPTSQRPRAAASAALLASSSSAQYVPPAPLPASVQPRNPAYESMATTRNSTIPPAVNSLPPQVYSAPPPPAAKRSGLGLFAVGGVFALAAAAAVGFFAVGGAKALGLGGGTGTVVVTATGPGGAPVSGLRVLSDGTVSCESSPCRISALTSGTHFITVEGAGFTTTAPRAVSVERNGEATLAIELAPKATEQPKAAPPSAPEATSPNALPPIENAAKPTESPKASAPAAKTAKADSKGSKPGKEAKQAEPAVAAGDATLNINSIPLANVVLDGRPMGSTPLVGVKVSAGPHSVVFIHPEHGRKSAGTTVKAGGSATVAVRF